ncbi:putative membrane protein [Fontimonas thermophila]|uniref:Protoporphyrinogen IX oxidase n=2 Tax=Fontimonas thermophila TaxID=1076937 RepID=A0A1I2J9M3_9GAMM|nr:putative membrane protein [Fontimonas thermophila]
MLWVKAFHIVFVVSWFAGLFYLPRLFVYHADTRDAAGHERFCVMERRLYGITTIGMLGTWIFGIWLLLLIPQWLSAGWLHAKLALVVGLSGYHGWLKTRVRAFAEQRNDKSARFYRIVNEVPALVLVAIVILVVVKPF